MCVGVGRAMLRPQSDREEPMPKVSKQTASTTEQAPGYEGRFEDLGGYTVAFETYSEDADLAPLFAGLPDDRAETIEAGEAYFAPPGHTPELHAGTELVEFSPTAELERTLEVVLGNV